MFRFRIVGAILSCGLLAAAQSQPQTQTRKRDLKIEELEPETAAPKRRAAPRSWAVIVGIAHYQKLPDNQQLQFPERDAESIYTVLISKEGGDFKREKNDKNGNAFRRCAPGRGVRRKKPPPEPADEQWHGDKTGGCDA